MDTKENRWVKLTAEEIRAGTSEDGTSLAVAFCEEFRRVFGYEICSSCPDFYNQHRKYIHWTMDGNKNETGFLLNPQFNGIPLEPASQIYVTNERMTLDQALHLLKNHPLGAELFDKIPDEYLGTEGNEEPTPTKEAQTTPTPKQRNAKNA